MIKKTTVIACLLGLSALAAADIKDSEQWYGEYKLKDRGYVNPIGIPRCDASAEKILEQWRGTLTIKYSKGEFLVNDEPWTLRLNSWCPNVEARRSPDQSIKGQIGVSFLVQSGHGPKGKERRGTAYLHYSDEDTKCTSAIAFAGKWAPP